MSDSRFSSNNNQNLIKIEIETAKSKLKDVFESYLIYYISESPNENFSDNILQNLKCYHYYQPTIHF